MADVGDAVHYEYASHGIGETQGTKVTPLHGSEGTIHVIEVPYYYISRTCQLHQQRAQTLSKSKVDGVAVEARYQHHQAGNRDESIGTCYSGGESSGTCWRVSLGAPLVYSHNCSYMYARMYGAARL